MNGTPPQTEETGSTNEPEPITLRQFFERIGSAKERKQEAFAESSEVHQTLRKVLEDCESEIKGNMVKTDPWVPALEWIVSISAALFFVASFVFLIATV